MELGIKGEEDILYELSNANLGLYVLRNVRIEIDDNVAHHRANGDSCFSLSPKAGGENIAYGQRTPYSVMYNQSDEIDPYSSTDMDHSSWMRSAGHRKNILNSSNSDAFLYS